MVNFSRRELANYAADQILAKNKEIVNQLASYLHETSRTKEANLLVRDINSALADRGFISAEVSSQHELDDTTRNELKTLLSKRYKTNDISINELIDLNLLGGVKIRTAHEEFDGSLRRKINRLKVTKA